jgi:mannose-6-phosphate isomerase-like protein (cupin superfamily)
MHQKIHSKLEPKVLLASILSADLANSRTDAASSSEILQASLLKLPKGKSITPHRHLPLERNTVGTSEAWIIMSGLLTAQIFDIDNSPVETVELRVGDCMILYRGGHTFTVMSEDVVLYEIKNGPYYGPTADSERFK